MDDRTNNTTGREARPPHSRSTNTPGEIRPGSLLTVSEAKARLRQRDWRQKTNEFKALFPWAVRDRSGNVRTNIDSQGAVTRPDLQPLLLLQPHEGHSRRRDAGI